MQRPGGAHGAVRARHPARGLDAPASMPLPTTGAAVVSRSGGEGHRASSVLRTWLSAGRSTRKRSMRPRGGRADFARICSVRWLPQSSQRRIGRCGRLRGGSDDGPLVNGPGPRRSSRGAGRVGRRRWRLDVAPMFARRVVRPQTFGANRPVLCSARGSAPLRGERSLTLRVRACCRRCGKHRRAAPGHCRWIRPSGPSLVRRIAPRCPGARVKASPSSSPVRCSPCGCAPHAASGRALAPGHLVAVHASRRLRRADLFHPRRKGSHEQHTHPHRRQPRRGAVPRPRDSPTSRRPGCRLHAVPVAA
jgi:hypothetical protein